METKQKFHSVMALGALGVSVAGLVAVVVVACIRAVENVINSTLEKVFDEE